MSDQHSRAEYVRPPEPEPEPQETAIEKLRRAVSWLDTEPEYLLQQLPTIAAIEEYFDLWATYGTDGFDGIVECIEEGADTAPYNALVEKYALPWQTWDGKRWVDPPKRTA